MPRTTIAEDLFTETVISTRHKIMPLPVAYTEIRYRSETGPWGYDSRLITIRENNIVKANDILLSIFLYLIVEQNQTTVKHLRFDQCKFLDLFQVFEDSLSVSEYNRNN